MNYLHQMLFDDLKLHNFTYVTMKPADPSC